jgi:hypothetical protein
MDPDMDRPVGRSPGGRGLFSHPIFETFGERWWQKMIPRQIDCTSLAWPGVIWVFCGTEKDNETEIVEFV